MLLMIMGMVVVIALGVIGLLFYFLSKEGHKEIQEVVPVVDLSIFKNELSSAVVVETKVQGDDQVEEVKVQEALVDDGYQDRVNELEEELQQISEKAVAQAQEALGMIDQLKKQNESLEEEKRLFKVEYEAKVKEAGEHITELRNDNSVLQVQLDNSRQKIVDLEQEMVVIKQQMEVELRRANAQLEEIGKEKDEAVAEAVNYQIAAMKAEYDVLTGVNLDLQKTIQKLKELNDVMTAKNDVLQYELIKNRAQASGFERMCENYRMQMEELLAKDSAKGRGVVSLLKA
jgi:chromosome segregation ATPase